MKILESKLRKIIKEELAGLGTAEEERASIVAWLREVAATMNHNGSKCSGIVEDLATDIENGYYRNT